MKLFLYFLRLFVSAISYIYTYNLRSKLTLLSNIVHTYWIKRNLGSLGTNSYICTGCLLQGGGCKHVYIGENTTVGSNCILGVWSSYNCQEFSPRIIIGDNCNIGEYNHISSRTEVVIGSGVLTGRYVYISDNSHGDTTYETLLSSPISRDLFSKGAVHIGDNVWIGDKVTILSGVSIGQCAIIGANSVVTKDVPPYSVVGGSPARVIKSYAKQT